MKSSKHPLASRFERSEGIVRHRAIARSVGEPGSGRTHFWLGAPGPIVVQSLDQGLEGVALEEYGRKDIYPIDYEWAPHVSAKGDERVSKEERDRLQEEAIEIRDRLMADYEYALKHARTILWDKETQIWELCRYADFGEPNDAPRNYPKLNQRYRRYINMPKSRDLNFGLIQDMRDEWQTVKLTDRNSGQVKEKPKSTGRRIAAGFSELDGLVHINLFHERRGGKFYVQVGKARGPAAHEIQDQEFGPLTPDAVGLTFAEFGQLAFPESKEEDWV